MRKVALLGLFCCFIVFGVRAEDAADQAPVQAMKAYEQVYDSLMENVVNVQTPGYKAFDSAVVVDNDGLIKTKKNTRFTKGNLIETGGKLDVAIDGDGFFVVQTPAGLAYTRDGRFILDRDYRLITLVGNFPVLTSAGQIYLTPSSGEAGMVDVQISPQGAVLQDKTFLGRLLVVRIEDMSQLHRINGSFFRTDDVEKITGVVREDLVVKPGYIEASNVDLSKQLVEIPLNSKKYDANSKALQILKRTTQTAREMGRVQ